MRTSRWTSWPRRSRSTSIIWPTFSARATGCPPIQYVQTLRLEESKYLLRTTDFAIKQIASITGFSSLGYFSQRFSKAEGMSPAKYRVMAQNKLIGGAQ